MDPIRRIKTLRTRGKIWEEFLGTEKNKGKRTVVKWKVKQPGTTFGPESPVRSVCFASILVAMAFPWELQQAWKTHAGADPKTLLSLGILDYAQGPY